MPALPPEPLHDAAVRTVNRLSATSIAISCFTVVVSPVTFMLIGCVDLFPMEACEEAPGKKRENRLPDGIVKVVISSIMAG